MFAAQRRPRQAVPFPPGPRAQQVPGTHDRRVQNPLIVRGIVQSEQSQQRTRGASDNIQPVIAVDAFWRNQAGKQAGVCEQLRLVQELAGLRQRVDDRTQTDAAPIPISLISRSASSRAR
ncbi:hypothetical protein KDK_49430 [Dictyobacter kobayashii]|uniref:Uncharacterized protein n=1 Tax=Dictyobacter kobayashii TaxID=2014872 RepID=A0A402APQ0_9CHLR|nr:hypothetical protein KDK_49430 [Dictyobacter kobayashii]